MSSGPMMVNCRSASTALSGNLIWATFGLVWSMVFIPLAPLGVAVAVTMISAWPAIIGSIITMSPLTLAA